MKDSYCPLVPHTMYCLPLWPGISMVLLTKVSAPPPALGPSQPDPPSAAPVHPAPALLPQCPSTALALALYQLLDGFSELEKKPEGGARGWESLRSHSIVADLRSEDGQVCQESRWQELQVRHRP